MNKTVTKTVKFCDGCGKEDAYPQACLRCGKEYCYECQNKNGVTYRHGVFFQGSGNGFYCTPCDQVLTQSHSDKRHTAYQAIKLLREECTAWNEDFQIRRKCTEEYLKSLSK